MSQPLLDGAATICGYIENAKRGAIRSLWNDQKIMSQRQLRYPLTCESGHYKPPNGAAASMFAYAHYEATKFLMGHSEYIRKQPFQAPGLTLSGPYGRTLNHPGIGQGVKR